MSIDLFSTSDSSAREEVRTMADRDNLSAGTMFINQLYDTLCATLLLKKIYCLWILQHSISGSERSLYKKVDLMRQTCKFTMLGHIPPAYAILARNLLMYDFLVSGNNLICHCKIELSLQLLMNALV